MKKKAILPVLLLIVSSFSMVFPTHPLNKLNLEIMKQGVLADSEPIVSYTSNDINESVILSNGDTAVGDHVVLNVTAPEFIPEDEIISMELLLSSGVYYVSTGTLVIPDGSYDLFGTPVIDFTQFTWEYIPEINSGDELSLELDFTNSDCDVVAWLYSIDGLVQDNSEWQFGNNLLSDSMATGSHPEVGYIIADFIGESATLAVGIFDFDLQNGTYTLTVDGTLSDEVESDGSSVYFDTYQFLSNASRHVEVTVYTDTNMSYTYHYDFTFENFFSPAITNLTVVGDGAVKYITWDVEDRNAQDEHFCEVLLSFDYGLSFMLMMKNITTNSYTWDSTGWLFRDYEIMVRVFDNDPYENPDAIHTGDYWPRLGDIETVPVTAGTEFHSDSDWTTWDCWSSYYYDSSSSSSTYSSSTEYLSTVEITTTPESSQSSTEHHSNSDTTAIFQVVSLAITLSSLGVIVIFSILIAVTRMGHKYSG